MQKWLLGFDGGGSNTIALATDITGKELVKSISSASNYHTVGIDGFQRVIVNLINDICLNGNLNLSDLQATGFALAGVDRPDDLKIINQALFEIGFSSENIHIVNDAIAALVANTGQESGIILISGTGSIVYGINSQGRKIRVGGWGHRVGDEGSGYWIARQGLINSLRIWDGREHTVSILPLTILKELQLNDHDELIGYIYAPATGKCEIAKLAKTVIECSLQGDTIASRIIEQAAELLAEQVLCVINQGFISEYNVQVVASGGIIQNVAQMQKIIRQRIAGKAELFIAKRESVWGAIVLAQKLANVNLYG